MNALFAPLLGQVIAMAVGKVAGGLFGPGEEPEPKDFLGKLMKSIEGDDFLSGLMADLPGFVKQLTDGRDAMPIGELMRIVGPTVEGFLDEKRRDFEKTISSYDGLVP